ncbi:hypothetical protein KTD55_27475 [Burkholderia gladioli]|uniref:hypothetical protein n=1 Tax=Burkholderia gladioli TaxID=28095 RepID=UPI00163FF2CE|nr:hypothetical protein [Burkholderia gladioli]MBU9217810.1 hypothetical protein [Burkholderia gladioli]
MTASLQDISQEQVDALKQQSQAAYDAEVKARQELAGQRPALETVLNQKVHPQSLCGCGCQQIIGGYFCFEGCGCSCNCGPQTETIQISGGPIAIGPNAPRSGTMVTFTGHATGQGTSINIPNFYLQGTVVDAENVIGVNLALTLTIGNGQLTMTINDPANGRPLATLVHTTGYGNAAGQFYGTGYGMFIRA